jgi:2-polyprenyl-3-methyl-5-hydroxy-6-metoxy-1,4-benzoquinol methylase
VADAPDAPYRRAFDPDSSYGSAVRLVEAIGASSGVVLDLGCGYGPVAEPLRDLGLDYVGLDLDGEGLADLAGRGFETAHLDLELPGAELEARLAEQLGDRALVAVLALDALEHVRDPWACTAAAARLAQRHPGARLVLSLPNVTHVDVAGKLLLGRWDVRTTGLLDHTHVQFFDEARAVELATSAGWVAVGADDVHLEFTEQCDPPDAPQLRPGSPLNHLLRSVRRDADAHEATYQFVRSYALGPDGPDGAAGEALRGADPHAAAALMAVVVAVPAEERGAVLADLAAQTVTDLRVLLVANHAEDADAARSDAAQVDLHVTVVEGPGEVDAALHDLDARYTCAIRAGERVDPEWLRWFAEGIALAPGRVVVAGCRDAEGEPMEVARFDLVGQGLVGVVPGAAYAVPTAAVEAGVLGHGSQQVAHTIAGLARAAMWCGRYDLDVATCSASAPDDLALLDKAVALVLDEEPLVLAAGAATPLEVLRRELRAAQDQAAQATWARHELQVHLDAYVAASDAERAELHRKVAATATPMGVARVTARRAGSIVKRRILRRS